MMGSWGGGLIGLVNELVWLGVGILLLMWLWGQVMKK